MMYVVTGLTKMKNNRVCLSVYDTESQCYRRPIFEDSQITTYTIQNISLFSIIELTPIQTFTNITAPHTEDFPVEYTMQFAEVSRLDNNKQLEFLNQISVQSTYDVFGYDFNKKPYLNQKWGRYFVNRNTGIRSLGTVQASRVYLYYEKNFGESRRIRVDFTDVSGNEFNDIPFVSIEQNYWSNPLTYMQLFNQQQERANQIFVRVSLARPFQPSGWDRSVCFLQVSCIQCY